MTTTSQGAPEQGAPRLVHIGQILICPVHLANPYHAHRLRYPEACGRARVAALTAWRAGRLAPHLAAWIAPAEGAARRATPADVDWSTSGILAPADAPARNHDE